MTTDRVPDYAVLVLQGVENGQTQEQHRECQTFDEAMDAAREAAEKLPSWIAITIVHAQDYPRLIENAEAQQATAEPSEGDMR